MKSRKVEKVTDANPHLTIAISIAHKCALVKSRELISGSNRAKPSWIKLRWVELRFSACKINGLRQLNTAKLHQRSDPINGSTMYRLGSKFVSIYIYSSQKKRWEKWREKGRQQTNGKVMSIAPLTLFFAHFDRVWKWFILQLFKPKKKKGATEPLCNCRLPHLNNMLWYCRWMKFSFLQIAIYFCKRSWLCLLKFHKNTKIFFLTTIWSCDTSELHWSITSHFF